MEARSWGRERSVDEADGDECEGASDIVDFSKRISVSKRSRSPSNDLCVFLKGS